MTIISPITRPMYQLVIYPYSAYIQCLDAGGWHTVYSSDSWSLCAAWAESQSIHIDRYINHS
jgi:hypothetical protein